MGLLFFGEEPGWDLGSGVWEMKPILFLILYPGFRLEKVDRGNSRIPTPTFQYPIFPQSSPSSALRPEFPGTRNPGPTFCIPPSVPH